MHLEYRMPTVTIHLEAVMCKLHSKDHIYTWNQNGSYRTNLVPFGIKLLELIMIDLFYKPDSYSLTSHGYRLMDRAVQDTRDQWFDTSS